MSGPRVAHAAVLAAVGGPQAQATLCELSVAASTEAAGWLLDRAVGLARSAFRARDLLEVAADHLSDGGSALLSEVEKTAMWLIAGELQGRGAQVDAALQRALMDDPAALNAALVNIVAAMSRAQDGPGAVTWVRSIRPA